MALVTQQQLEDASRDADDLGRVVNGAADLNTTGTVPTRTGGDRKTLAKIEADIDASLTAIEDAAQADRNTIGALKASSETDRSAIGNLRTDSQTDRDAIGGLLTQATADANGFVDRAASIALDAMSWGTGQDFVATSVSATNYNSTVIFNDLIPAGTALDKLFLNIAASGAGAINLVYVTRNPDGTENNAKNLDSVVVSSTGWQGLSLRDAGNVYVTPAEGYVAFRRAATNSATFYNDNTAPTGVVRTILGLITGSNQVTTSVGNVLPAYLITGSVPRKGEDLYDQAVRDGEAICYDPNDRVTYYFGRRDLAVGSSTGVNTTAFFDYDPIPRSGFIKTITLDFETAGAMLFTLMRGPTSAAKLVRQIYLTGETTGKITFTAGVDFPANIPVEKGWWRGITPVGGSIRTGGSNSGGIYSVAHPIIAGNSYAMTTTLTSSLSIEMSVESVAMPLAVMHETMGDRLRGSTMLTHQNFAGTSTPTGWTIGDWSVNNGLLSPAVGANTSAKFACCNDTARNLTRFTDASSFDVLNPNNQIQIGFGANDNAANNQLIVLDAETNTVQIRTYQGPGQTMTTRASRSLAGTFTDAFGTQARRYTYMLKRSVNRVYFELRDTLKDEVFRWTVKSNFFGRVLGQPGVFWLRGSGSAGDVRINWFQHSADVNRDVFLIGVGDSISDGWAVPDAMMPSHFERIDAIRNKGDVLTVARFGIATTAQLDDLKRLVPKLRSAQYVCYYIGGNDSSQAVIDANYTGTMTVTANLTSGSKDTASISAPPLAIAVGMGVSGVGVPAGTVVEAVGLAGGNIRLSNAATSSGTGVTLTLRFTGLIDIALNLGATPIICTLTPKAGFPIAGTNDNIRNGVYGRYPVVDVSRALTLNNDMTNWEPAYNFDNVHPNGAGYAKLVRTDANGIPVGTFAAEAPFLFNGALSTFIPGLTA